MIVDQLIEKTLKTGNPSVVGIDTDLTYLREEDVKHVRTLEDAGKAILDFNLEIIDAVKKIVPAVKVQIAYYEAYGLPGLKAFEETLRYAKKQDLIVMADVKRNDIGSTAGKYSKAYLGKTRIGAQEITPFDSDYITVTPYLGSDGILPFVEDCKAYDKGIFVLVKTSNPSGEEFQDQIVSGKTLYEQVASKVCEWGKDLIGTYGYSSVGAVVGATKPKQAEVLRREFPSLYFLVPGYGAQGGTADSLANCFDANGLGAIVNSSRGILCAHKSEKYKGLHYGKAARRAAEEMREDIVSELKKRGGGAKL